MQDSHWRSTLQVHPTGLWEILHTTLKLTGVKKCSSPLKQWLSILCYWFPIEHLTVPWLFFFCNSCNYFFQSHRRQHNKDKPYKCTNCNKGYIDAASLEVHMSTHTVKHARIYSCGLCNRTYTSVRQMSISEEHFYIKRRETLWIRHLAATFHCVVMYPLFLLYLSSLHLRKRIWWNTWRNTTQTSWLHRQS